MFSSSQVEKLIEQAYLNGVSDAAISYMRTGLHTSNVDYKKSAAFHDFQISQKKEPCPNCADGKFLQTGETCLKCFRVYGGKDGQI